MTSAQWAPGGQQILLAAQHACCEQLISDMLRHCVTACRDNSSAASAQAFFSGRVALFDPKQDHFVQDFTGHADCVHSMKLV